MRLTSLPFDAARRFAVFIHILDRLDLPSNAKLLDVGGHPGTLARLLTGLHEGWTVHTVDTIEASLDDYTQASGAKLPFDNDSFDVVLSSDTLEHVPHEARSGFLAEIQRVSRGFVVLGAPFAHAAVSGVERAIAQSHLQATGRPHPWLGEHLEHGLPDLHETLAAFAGSGTRALMRSAPLLDWTCWQLAALAREVTGSLESSWKGFEERLAGVVQDWERHDMGALLEFELVGAPGEREFLPYRWVLIVQPEDRAPYPAPPEEWVWCASELEGESCLAHAAVFAPVIAELANRQTSGEELQLALDDQVRRALVLAESSEPDSARSNGLKGLLDRFRAGGA